MSRNKDLCFISDDADENDGLGDAGIETYKDSVYASIARETGQNSRDASVAKPVIMKFDVIEIDRHQFPGYEKLDSTVGICLKQAVGDKDQKAIDFFKRAKEVLTADKIKVLHAADYNTKGLDGPSERGKAFHSLVKGSGISIKESQTSGGSFGIGKNAAFAISELQTVFYSSQYRDKDGKLHFISQGKTIFVSHTDENGERKKAKGYWGLPGFKAITDLDEVPEWLRRKEQGTSIFCAGFRYQEGWQYMMAASIIANFFVAIHRGEMEFAINNGEIQLNHENLAYFFENDQIKIAAEENNILEKFDFAKSLFKCLTSTYTKDKVFSHGALGKISFKILVGEGLPKKLALIRNGMVITDSLEYFGDKFAKFPMSKEFIAIVEAQESLGNSIIKDLENPRHDGLSAERINDPRKRRDYNAAIKSLINMIRNAIKEETTTIPDKEVAINELTEFFAEDSTQKSSNDPEDEDNLESFVYEVNPKNQPRQPDIELAPKTNPRSGSKPSPKHGQRPKPKSKPTPQPTQQHGSISVKGIKICDTRNIVVNDEGKTFRRIFFTAPLSCEAQIAIKATGINEVEDLRLVSSRAATLFDNRAVLNVIEGQRVFFDVEIAENYQGPIEIIAYTTGGSNEAE